MYHYVLGNSEEYIYFHFFFFLSVCVNIFMCRNTCVTMGATFSAPEFGLKVADVSKIRTLNAIARNTL